MLRRPFSSRTTRAKKSLSAVDSTPKRVATPGAIASSMPRSESDFQLSSVRAVAASRTIASGREPARSVVALVARKSSTVASPFRATLVNVPRGRSQRTSPLKLVCAFCTSTLKISSRYGSSRCSGRSLSSRASCPPTGCPASKPFSSPRASMLPTTPLPTALPLGPAGTLTRAARWTGAGALLSSAQPRSCRARSSTSSATGELSWSLNETRPRSIAISSTASFHDGAAPASADAAGAGRGAAAGAFAPSAP